MARAGALNVDTLEEFQSMLKLTDLELGFAAEAALRSREATGLNRLEWVKFADLLAGFDAIAAADQFDELEQAHLNQKGAASLSASVLTDELEPAVQDVTTTVEQQGTAILELGVHYGTLRDEEVTPLTEALREAKDAQTSLTDALRAAADPVFRAQSAFRNYQETLKRIDKDGKRTAEEQLELASAILDTQAALDGLSGDALTDALDAIAIALGITSEEVVGLLNQLGLLDGTTASVLIDVQARTAERFQLPGFDIPSGVGRRRSLAHGGTFNAGDVLTIGERLENVVFDQPGTVVPGSSVAGLGDRNVTVNVTAPPGDQHVRQGVMAALLTADIREQVEFMGATDI
jgi:hypothetical protein